ncbi:MAG: hypothetical protein II948_10790, partial [Synergistaceae bacterium]|nr:hypothetical protein [Synergistaceae bacterium]
ASSSGNLGGGALYLSPVGSATIESCTFNGNKVTYGDNSCGGAVYIANSAASSIQNCTFYGNYTSSASSENDGGALYVNGTETTVVSFCTFANNGSSSTVGTILGGSIFVHQGQLRIIGTIAVGNTGTGDVYLYLDGGGSITSSGYNRVGTLAAGNSSSSGYINWDSNNVGTNAGNDISNSSWGFADFFGENELAANYNSNTAGTGNDAIAIPTLALSESNPNSTKAIDGARSLSSGTVIPSSSCPRTDERGVLRFSNAGAAPDIGAFEVNQSGSSSDDDSEYASYTIRSIKISGIPNTLSIVGQTAILHATVTYVNGTTTTTAEPLTWHSDNTNVAVFESSSSGAIYTRSIGEAKITVSARDNEYSDSAKIYVIWEQEDTNIHPNVVNLVNQLNLQLDNDNINFYIMANAPDDANLLTDKKFTSEFQKAYNSKPSFADYESNNFSSNSSFSRAAKSGLKDSFTPGINTALNNQYAGLLLPVFCTWEFELADLADEFNIDEEELYSMSDAEFSSWLFKNINIGFARTNGNFLPAVSSSNQSSLQSASKAKAKAAASSSSGALSVNRGGDSVTVSMRAYLANVTPNGSEGSSLISDSTGTKRLIIPAGSNPISNTANISGTIWTTKLASSSSNNSDSDSDSSSGSGKKSGGGGGGGCSSLNLNLIALILLALLFNRKHA